MDKLILISLAKAAFKKELLQYAKNEEDKVKVTPIVREHYGDCDMPIKKPRKSKGEKHRNRKNRWS